MEDPSVDKIESVFWTVALVIALFVAAKPHRFFRLLGAGRFRPMPSERGITVIRILAALCVLELIYSIGILQKWW